MPLATMTHCSIPQDNRPVYAIGDLHGCAQLYQRIEAAITKDQGTQEAHIVLLGDVIDRGPDSADLLDHLLRRPPAGQTRHVLMGNHEAMFARFLDDPARAADWLSYGGWETLLSYGINAHSFASWPAHKQRICLDAHIPDQHRQFVTGLPAVLSWGKLVFAHAGVDFSIPLTEQKESVVLWNAQAMSPDQVPPDHLFIHGHFPIAIPNIHQRVINMDVGAYLKDASVVLRIDPNWQMRLIAV